MPNPYLDHVIDPSFQEEKRLFVLSSQNLNQGKDVIDNTTMLLTIEEAKETILDFSQGTVNLL